MSDYVNKNPVNWTEKETYEAAFTKRVRLQELKLRNGPLACSDFMPVQFKSERYTSLRHSWIRGWQDAI